MTDVDDWSDRDYGSPREEPDFDAIAMEEHFDEFHPDGGPCNCPPGEPLAPEPPGGYDDEPPF